MENSISMESTVNHWKEIRQGNAPPFRYDFGQIEDNIQFILQFSECGRFRIKKPGMYFESLFCGMLQGRSLDSLFVGKNVDKLDKDLANVFDGPSITHITFSIGTDEYDMTLLPVRADHGPINEALGVVNLNAMPVSTSPFANYLHSSTEKLVQKQTSTRLGFAEEKKKFEFKRTQFKVIEGNASKSSHKADLEVINNMKREP